MMVASGSSRHTCTVITEPIARYGMPSHMGQSFGRMSPIASSVQLITL
jgi:hypothetical protein